MDEINTRCARITGVQAIPEAATLLATGRAAAAQESQLQRLQAWAPAPLLQVRPLQVVQEFLQTIASLHLCPLLSTLYTQKPHLQQ